MRRTWAPFELSLRFFLVSASIHPDAFLSADQRRHLYILPIIFFFFFTPSSLRVMLQMQSRGGRDSFLQGARRGAQVLQRSQSSLHCLDAGGDASTTEQLLIGAFQFRQKRAPFHSLGDAVCGASFAPFTWSHDGAFSSDFIFTPPCSRAGSILHLVH